MKKLFFSGLVLIAGVATAYAHQSTIAAARFHSDATSMEPAMKNAGIMKESLWVRLLALGNSSRVARELLSRVQELPIL